MPTKFLKAQCLHPGTSFSEAGKTVSVKPAGGEKIVFFRLDCQAFRQEYGLLKKPVCDLLVDYAKRKYRVTLFVELKGAGGLATAEEQVLNAYLALKKQLVKLVPQPTLRALIVTASSAAPDLKRRRKRLSEHGLDVHYKTGVRRSCDIGEWLRNT